MKTATKNAWAAVVESMKAETLGPDDMTADQFARDTGRSVSQAGKILNGMVRDGKATKRYVVYHNTRTAAYRLTK